MNRNLFIAGMGCVAISSSLFLMLLLRSGQNEQPRQRDADGTNRSSHSLAPTEQSVGSSGRHYVGSQACETCHREEYESYKQTSMGRSLAISREQKEPPDGEFWHAKSGRRFEVYRKGDKLVHRESLADGPVKYTLAEHFASFVVGSGNHSKTYLVEADGFLVESPITWYRSKQAWGMSPGYDIPLHAGFGREVPEKCLICHAGRTRAVDGSLHRIEFLEHAIGCERCHGPGSSHVNHHSSPQSESLVDDRNLIDETIVNPARLTRELAQDVCYQCHLTTKAYVPARGRKLEDYRPGLPLQDFRHFYTQRSPDPSMRVVGHVEQLMLSDCYRQSETLSCLSCHNPHKFPAPTEQEQHYRDICLQCHDQQSCQVSPSVLTMSSPTNDCVKCHMPTTKTNIPHLAFTHHRIGIHEKHAGTSRSELPTTTELIPFKVPSDLSQLDRDRSLGLAYLSLIDTALGDRSAKAYASRGTQLLLKSKKGGMRDGEVDAALARTVWPHDRVGALRYAHDALQDATLSAIGRVNSLYAIAATYCEQQRFAEALSILDQLTRLRRNAGDWMLLGDCLLATEDIAGATAAYEKAVEIIPNLLEVHELIVVCYERTDDFDKAQERRNLARAIAATRIHHADE